MNDQKIKRNVMLFVVGVLLTSTLGGIIMATVGEIGGLVFIIGANLDGNFITHVG